MVLNRTGLFCRTVAESRRTCSADCDTVLMLDLTALEAMGFEAPRTFWTMNRKEPPKHFGAYVVLRTCSDPPSFLQDSTGGTYRKDPTTRPPSELYRRWVPGTPIMYIGAAGLKKQHKSTLRSRLSAYQRYGHGKDGVSHEGGNRIWQLQDVRELAVTWKQTPGVPGKVLEDELLALFELAHDCLPFANGRH